MTPLPRADNGRYLPRWIVRDRPIVYLDPAVAEEAPEEWAALLRRQLSARRIAMLGAVVIGLVFVVLVVWR